MSFQPGGLTINDSDGDAYTDSDAAEERAEGDIFTANGLPANFSGYFNANDAAVTQAGLSTGQAALIASAFLVAVAKNLIFTVVCAAVEVFGFITTNSEASAQTDPYDPNYHSLYTPISFTLPNVPDDPSLTTGFRADALNLMQAEANVASYANALDVTENRMLSAINAGDLASFQLQNAQLNKFSLLLGEAHGSLAQAETTWASDIVNVGLNVSVTQTQVASYISQLQTQGVSALPAEEQAILNSLTPDQAQQQAILQSITSRTLPAASTDLVSMLISDANTNTQLSALYSNVPSAMAVADFIGNNTSDVLLQNGGTVVDWIMQNGAYSSGNVLTGGASGWSVVGTGHLTGSAVSDVLLQNGGTVVDWIMQNGKYQSGSVITTSAAGWQVVGTGAFTGSSPDDVLVQSGGTVVDWIMQDGQYQSGNVLSTGAAGWRVVGTGDFTGNGTSDVLLQNGGTVVDWIMQDGAYSSGNVLTGGAAGWSVVGTGDFSGKGTSDVLLQNGGTVVDWIMQNGKYVSGNVLSTAAAGWTVVGTGDYNGDGTSDVLLQNGGTVVDWTMKNGAYQSGNVITNGAAGFQVAKT